MTGPDITIDVQAELPLPAAAVRDMLAGAATAALAYHDEGAPAALTILLGGSEQIRRLNREFMGEDKATDVLSFPAGDAMPGMDDYLGDIAIAVPVAADQAAAAGHELLHELALLAVHGVLHLLGYDHATPAEQQHMWQVQDAILAMLELPLRSPPFSNVDDR
jgi:probable rRNA maturation factor